MDFDYLKQKRILLVDDEQELLDMVISILNEDGFQKYQKRQKRWLKRLLFLKLTNLSLPFLM